MTFKCYAENCKLGFSFPVPDKKLQCAVCFHTFHAKCGGLVEKDADNLVKIMEECIYVKYHCSSCVGLKFVEMVKYATDKMSLKNWMKSI